MLKINKLLRSKLTGLKSDRRGDMVQTLLIIGAIAVPLMIFIASAGSDSRDATEENIKDLFKKQEDLKKEYSG